VNDQTFNITPATHQRTETGSSRTVNDLIQLKSIDETSISTKAVARCADGNGTLTPLFFSDHVLDIARAKAICARCALRESCLADAIEREEPWGVWGGELLSMGRIVANKRPGGRPPKRPRPPVIVDELGIVESFFDFDDADLTPPEPVAV
jgi:WhiB family redox-sensing transcriptional regulator